MADWQSVDGRVWAEAKQPESVPNVTWDSDEVPASANPGLTRTEGWQAGPAPGPKSWTCSQCGHPGTAHKRSQCPDGEPVSDGELPEPELTGEDRW